MQVLGLLKSARASMKRDTWCLNTRNDGNGRGCILGHIDLAANRGEYPPWARDEAVHALANAIPPACRRKVTDAVIKTIKSYGFIEVTDKTHNEHFVAAYNNISNYDTVSRWFDRVILLRELLDLGVPMPTE